MTDMIAKLREAFSGKKTYLVAAMVIAIGLAEGVFGIDLPGVEVGEDWLAYILNGIGLGTLRAGVQKAVGPKG